jgi:hypothetical protein
MIFTIFVPHLNHIVNNIHQFLLGFEKHNLNKVLNNSQSLIFTEKYKCLDKRKVREYSRIINEVFGQCYVCSIDRMLQPDIKLMFENENNIICNYCMLDSIMGALSEGGYSSDEDIAN